MYKTNKEELELMLSFSFIDPLNIETAWDTYKRYLDMIIEADVDTIDYLWRLVKTDRNGMLKARMNFAEKGFELTPSQFEQYIFVLATSLVDSIEQKKS
jgi:hypothetical protein